MTIRVQPAGPGQAAVLIESSYRGQLYALKPVHDQNLQAVVDLIDPRWLVSGCYGAPGPAVAPWPPQPPNR